MIILKPRPQQLSLEYYVPQRENSNIEVPDTGHPLGPSIPVRATCAEHDREGACQEAGDKACLRWHLMAFNLKSPFLKGPILVTPGHGNLKFSE